MAGDSMPIRAITEDGTIEFAPETFVRFEIDLGNGQSLWVKGPEVCWYLNDEPAAELIILGGPGSINSFHPVNSNTVLAVALQERRKKAAS